MKCSAFSGPELHSLQDGSSGSLLWVRCLKALVNASGCNYQIRHLWCLGKRVERGGEILVVCLVIVIVWGLLALPVIFYHLRRSQAVLGLFQSAENLSNSTTCGVDIESDASGVPLCEPYTGTMCTSVLQSLQDCYAPGRTDFFVSSRGGDQSSAEQNVRLLVTFLNFLDAPQDCRDAALPFTCHYLFPLCGPTGELLQPNCTHCHHVNNDVCADVWQTALQNPSLAELAAERIPRCSELPVSTPQCEAGSPSTNFSQRMPTNSSQRMLPGSGMDNITCAPEFSFINGSCIARCDSWEQSSRSVTLAVMVVELVAAALGLLAGTTLLVVSCIRWRNMFSFPSVFIVYMTIGYCILAMFVVMTYFDQSGLYCGELSVNAALRAPTIFCTLSGVVLQYFLLNITLWWFFHVCCIFWKLSFPMHARKHRQNQKWIHLALVLAGVLIPFIGVAAALATGGYTLNRFPPLFCGAANPDIQYYSVWLVINILVAVAITMIVLMFWKVHKQQGIFRVKVSDSKPLFALSTAEKKLLFVFLYYTIFASIILAYFGVSNGDQANFIRTTAVYFSCEASGHDPENPCPRNYEQYTYPGLAATSYMLMGFIPAVNLMFVVHFQKLQQTLSVFCKRHLLRRLTTHFDVPDGSHGTGSSTNHSGNGTATTLSPSHT